MTITAIAQVGTGQTSSSEKIKTEENAQLPLFPGCEELDAPNEDLQDCSKSKLLEFVYKHVEYPGIARENGVEGTVVIQFIIEKDGTVSEEKIIRDIGANCGKAALVVVDKMREEGILWKPGIKNNEAARVLYTLPVKFTLHKKKRKKRKKKKKKKKKKK